MKYALLALTLIATMPAFGQVALQPKWVQVPPSADDIALQRNFQKAQAESPECRRMHIGCPECMFTQATDYSRSEFTRDCRALAPSGRGRAAWLRSCAKDAP